MLETTRKKRVLIVDDQHAIADTFAIILGQNGFEAVTAYSGEQAVATAATFQPDVLISDVVMGKMNGIELAVAISDSFPGCDIVLISGNPNTGTLLATAQAQGHAFEILPKPLHPSALMERLRASS